MVFCEEVSQISIVICALLICCVARGFELVSVHFGPVSLFSLLQRRDGNWSLRKPRINVFMEIPARREGPVKVSLLISFI